VPGGNQPVGGRGDRPLEGSADALRVRTIGGGTASWKGCGRGRRRRTRLLQGAGAQRADGAARGAGLGQAADRGLVAGRLGHPQRHPEIGFAVWITRIIHQSVERRQLIEQLQTTRQELVEAEREAGRLVWELRPASLATASLGEALQRQVQRLGEETGVAASATVTGRPRQLPADILRAVEAGATAYLRWSRRWSGHHSPTRANQVIPPMRI